MSTPPQIRRGKFVRITSLYCTLIAVFLLSALPLLSTMDHVEWTNFALLLIVVLCSGTLAFAPSRAWRLARAVARVLWVIGVGMFITQVARASEIESVGANPAVVISHVLILSLWASVITSATLVLWRDHASRTGAR